MKAVDDQVYVTNYDNGLHNQRQWTLLMHLERKLSPDVKSQRHQTISIALRPVRDGWADVKRKKTVI